MWWLPINNRQHNTKTRHPIQALRMNVSHRGAARHALVTDVAHREARDNATARGEMARLPCLLVPENRKAALHC